MPGPYDHVLDLLGRWRMASDARAAREAIAARHPRSRVMSKALPAEHRASPRQVVPYSYFAKAQTMTDQRAARASIAGTARELAALERATRAMAAEAAGEKRARIRAGVEDVLRRAMEGVGKGEISAVEVAKLEGHAMRILAAIEPGPRIARA